MDIITLASGAGLWDWAWRDAGANIVLQCENSEPQLSILKAAFPEAKHDTDIFKLTKEKIENEYGIKNLRDCAFVGGLCCQPFSKAGNQLGRLKDTWMCDELVRLTREFQPRFVVVENVDGLIDHPDGISYLSGQLGKAETGGYIGNTLCIPSKAFGAPHERYRTFSMFARDRLSDVVQGLSLCNAESVRSALQKIQKHTKEKLPAIIPGIYNGEYITEPRISKLDDGDKIRTDEHYLRATASIRGTADEEQAFQAYKEAFYEKGYEIVGNGVEYRTGYYIAATVVAFNHYFYGD